MLCLTRLRIVHDMFQRFFFRKCYVFSRMHTHTHTFQTLKSFLNVESMLTVVVWLVRVDRNVYNIIIIRHFFFFINHAMGCDPMANVTAIASNHASAYILPSFTQAKAYINFRTISKAT